MCFPFLKMLQFFFSLRIPVKCVFLHKADDGFFLLSLWWEAKEQQQTPVKPCQLKWKNRFLPVLIDGSGLDDDAPGWSIMDASSAVQWETKEKWVRFKTFQLFVKNLAGRLVGSRKERRPSRSLRRPVQFRPRSVSNSWRSKHGRRLKYRLSNAAGNDHRQQTGILSTTGCYFAAVRQMILKILRWSDYRLLGASTTDCNWITVQTAAFQLLLVVTKFLTFHFNVLGRLGCNHMAHLSTGWIDGDGLMTQNGATTTVTTFPLQREKPVLFVVIQSPPIDSIAVNVRQTRRRLHHHAKGK